MLSFFNVFTGYPHILFNDCLNIFSVFSLHILFSCYRLVTVIYVLWTQVYHHIYISPTFSLSLSLFFHSLYHVFQKVKGLNFYKIQFTFLLYLVTFFYPVCCRRNLCLTKAHKDFSLVSFILEVLKFGFNI